MLGEEGASPRPGSLMEAMHGIASRAFHTFEVALVEHLGITLEV